MMEKKKEKGNQTMGMENSWLKLNVARSVTAETSRRIIF